MTKRMNMSIAGESAEAALVNVVFRLQQNGDDIVVRAKTPDYDWHVVTFQADGTLKRYYGMGGPFQLDGGRIKLSESD